MTVKTHSLVSPVVLMFGFISVWVSFCREENVFQLLTPCPVVNVEKRGKFLGRGGVRLMKLMYKINLN